MKTKRVLFETGAVLVKSQSCENEENIQTKSHRVGEVIFKYLRGTLLHYQSVEKEEL